MGLRTQVRVADRMGKDCNCGAKEPRLPYGHTVACAYVTDSCEDEEEDFDD